MTWLVCFTLFFALAHSNAHPMYFPHVSFEPEQKIESERLSVYHSSVLSPHREGGQTQSRTTSQFTARVTREQMRAKAPVGELGDRVGLAEAHKPESNTQADQLGGLAVSPIFVRRVIFRHHGFADLLNDAILNEEQEYLNGSGSSHAESVYDQRKVANMGEELQDFWVRRGIAVEVTITLTQVPKDPRYAVLEVDVYRK